MSVINEYALEMSSKDRKEFLTVLIFFFSLNFCRNVTDDERQQWQQTTIEIDVWEYDEIEEEKERKVDRFWECNCNLKQKNRKKKKKSLEISSQRDFINIILHVFFVIVLYFCAIILTVVYSLQPNDWNEQSTCTTNN